MTRAYFRSPPSLRSLPAYTTLADYANQRLRQLTSYEVAQHVDIQVIQDDLPRYLAINGDDRQSVVHFPHHEKRRLFYFLSAPARQYEWILERHIRYVAHALGYRPERSYWVGPFPDDWSPR